MSAQYPMDPSRAPTRRQQRGAAAGGHEPPPHEDPVATAHGITQEIAPPQRLDVAAWQPRKFFSFYFSSIQYLAVAAYQLTRVAVPAVASSVVWAVSSVVKLVVLFFSLLILLIGPRIGLPRAVYQTTWKVLVSMGLVTPQNIMRAGADAAAAASGSSDAQLSSLTGALVRTGYQNTDIILVGRMVG
eukprot:CAMPEP_0173405894 /NCGR_PEP_ID=MMETSP1356-20130122/63063_1 /TAXON_ID=77927 ORGANISM="Hemiselmis virescens, Strain PCC157" /NCGR_SAMPLE_ID=MMETSP1356 /ASSEMBLY_ACC=CAM_ASM_000847 /LENGTH=186 /DNA_ID=CAMNT_0014366771 /DNA_START=33 /DNA_END=589 /DNA_ORIENTATION=+